MLEIYFFRMNAQEEHVNAELKSLHSLIGNIVNDLAENEEVDENLIIEGNSLLATVTEAIANYSSEQKWSVWLHVDWAQAHHLELEHP